MANSTNSDAALPKSIPRRTGPKRKQPARCVDVVQSTRLTPNMQRVVLAGPELSDFPSGRNGANLKIMVPHVGQTRDAFEAALTAASGDRIVRTFTIQNYEPAYNRLTIDFALHDGSSPAGDWAKTVTEGSFLGVTNGGPKKVTEFWGDAFLLASDMTGLPAMEAILADMPADAKGHAVFEVSHRDDARDLLKPDGIHVEWLVHPNPHFASSAQIAYIRKLAVSKQTQVAAVGEHSVVAALKSYFFDELGFDPAQHYLSPYWKIGLHEEEHQALKRAEA